MIFPFQLQRAAPSQPTRSAGFSRRRFLELSCAGSVCALGSPRMPLDPTPPARAAIVICNVGGPSQLDTWDPKPAAPPEIRGPYRAICTSVPGFFVSELFPHMARLAHLQAFVRSCCRSGPATHEAGWRSAHTGLESPAVSDAAGLLDVVTHAFGDCSTGRREVAPVAVLPGRMPGSDGDADGGSADALERLLARESDATRARYGPSRLGRDCLAARCLIEAGARFVMIRACHHYRARDSWDVHGGPAFGSVSDLQRVIGPAYDLAYAALVEDLAARGLLESTLLCALAEFGRTPRLNPAGGRDHWPRCWTTTFAGGGVRGGQTIGASDALGSEPGDRPVAPSEILGSIYYSLGLAATAPRGATNPAHALDRHLAMPRIAELF